MPSLTAALIGFNVRVRLDCRDPLSQRCYFAVFYRHTNVSIFNPQSFNLAFLTNFSLVGPISALTVGPSTAIIARVREVTTHQQVVAYRAE
jgi:hypothetical protein